MAAGFVLLSTTAVPQALASTLTSPLQSGPTWQAQASKDASAGATWLLNHGLPANRDWTAIASYAASASPLSSAGMTAEVSTLKATTDEARFILALLAEGQDPHQFAGRDFVASLASTQLQAGADAGKFADNLDGSGTDLVNSQAWTITALEDAGGASYNRTAAGNWLVAQQNSDGGFGYSHTYATSDPDDTASAVVALSLLGYPANSGPIAKALVFLKTQQTSDGGFKNGGSTSNSDSTGVVIDALQAVGISPLLWTQENGNPITALLHLYDNKSGGFNYDTAGNSWSGVSVYSTRDSVIGLGAVLSGQSVYQRLHWSKLATLNPYWTKVHEQNGLWLSHHWYTWAQIQPMAVAASYSYALTPQWQAVIAAHGMQVNGGWEGWDIRLATQALVARYGWDSLHQNGISSK